MRRVLIYGAGEAGEMVLQEIRQRPEENIVVLGFMDDDNAKQGRSVAHVPVRGGKDHLSAVIRELDINEVIIAMPSIRKPVIREVARICKRERVKLLIVPSTRAIIEGRVSYEQIKIIHPADLLEREEAHIESRRIREYLQGRSILVTGAAGSIGNELVRTVISYMPRQLILVDINENGLFYLLQALGDGDHGRMTDFKPHVADIKCKPMLETLFTLYRPDVVFHTAAYKHVPIMENNVRMIFLNNVIGTRNLLELASCFEVERFIGISTDKAVYPVSVMGKTKRIGELLLKSYAIRGLRASSVRFGNVLGSNGSVMTVFERQIGRGGPVTITSPDMERYFMTVQEAVSLVLQAGSMDGQGDIYVLEMGNPIRIRDLAENMIILSGYSPGVDMEISYTGVRAGEKLREQLFYREVDVLQSSFKGISIERCPVQDDRLIEILENIQERVYLIEEEDLLHDMDCIIRGGVAVAPSHALSP